MKFNFGQNDFSLQGEYIVPGDKSISHRIVIIASILNGVTIIKNLSDGEDVKHTINCMKLLGVDISGNFSDLKIVGKGLSHEFTNNNDIYLGNSGSSARMITGLLAGYDVINKISGDNSLNKRPMKRITEPLTKMGAKFLTAKDNNSMPLSIIGNSNLNDINYVMPVASAQVKSALLLAALRKNNITITETTKSRDHTELMLKYFDADIKMIDKNIILNGGKELVAKGEYIVPADPSAAAFLAVAATLIPHSKITIKDVNINPTRIGFYKILQKMGANIIFTNQRNIFNEDIADINVEYNANLTSVHVGIDYVPSMIDEYPILAIAAAHAKGTSRFDGLDELKFKESNRLVAIYEQLKQCGIEMQIGDNWLEIMGSSNITMPDNFETYQDHRIAMSLIILAAIQKKSVMLNNIDCISTSFPGFIDIFSV
jgi:3-phosphoshikimate 1-carboxyvinyltransferase